MPTHRLSTSFHRKPLSHAILIACLSLSGTALSTPFSLAQAQTDSTALYNFNIAAGNLETALQQFAAQSGISLAYSPERVKGRQSAGVQGQHSSTSALQTLLAGSGLYASTQSNGSYRLELAQASLDSTALPTAVIYGGRLKPDEVGHNNVYQENVTSVYQGREELQRFQVTNPGDVFKGMNGVYSMDTRSSQAITPNIRGITGEGRVPLTIDGTEQSTNVWLHMHGAGNRSYADPALFRSIEVEKGPSLSRGIKSGVGGAVNIRTIEAEDIIPDGDSWGVEMSARSSGNTSRSRGSVTDIYGKDYRDIPDARRVNITNILVPQEAPRNRGKGEAFNFKDNTGMLSIAGRNEITDILVAYSKRKQGNYYAGKNGTSKYSGHDPYDLSSTDAYFPNLTKLYHAGDEVFNTDSETETSLIKSNWNLPNQQKIGLQFMRTDLEFGETTPGDTQLAYGLRETFEHNDINNLIDWNSYPRVVVEKPRSEMRIDSYKIGYEFKPENSRWMDLETGLWHTKTTGIRYQSGKHPYGIHVEPGSTTEAQLDQYDRLVAYYTSMAHVMPPGQLEWILSNFPVPEHDGTIIPLGRQWTTHDRTGFEFSNLMQLRDNVQLTLGGSYQKEKLDERVQNNGINPVGMYGGSEGLHRSTDLLGPRNGERKEYSAMLNLSWQPTNWLNLTTGARYMHYKGKDTGTAKRRRQQDEFYKVTRHKAGMELEYRTVMTVEEQQYHTDIRNGYISVTQEEWDQFYANRTHKQDQVGAWGPAGVWYWENTTVVPMKNGKMDSSKNPFTNGQFDLNEVMENPYGVGYVNTVTPMNFFGEYSYEEVNGSQEWEMPEEQSGDAFSPVLSATVRISPFGTSFIRYAQTTRFPSLHELTSSAVVDGMGTQGYLAVDGASKPERSTNWEIGYAHDLRQFFPGLHLADARISYYNTEIKNFIDRDWALDTIQFDKKKSKGIELQTRFDSGRYFGNLGVTYRLNQEVCDKDYAQQMDPVLNRMPSCMTGGFNGTYSGNSLQPEYSVDLLLGTRLVNDKLELGWRSVYHAEAKNTDLDKLLASDAGSSITSWLPRDVWHRTQGVRSFYWKSVLLHDMYANFNANENLILKLGVTNITNEYYIDPMSKVLLPAPGRTITAGVTVNF